MKRGLLHGASAVAVLISTNLFAPHAMAQAAAAPAAGGSDTVGEVVVTAERRSQLLERVPVAITAFTSKQRDIQGIASVQDLTDYTPGLSYTTFDNRPYIRGIGRNTDNLAVESGVAVYVDGVYNGANASTILQLDTLFIDQIQVLRGPQSTLYGRNADGGAIDYISKRPTKDFEAEARTGYDNFDKYFLEAATSGPITDNLRFRLGGNYTHQTGGYYTNLSGPAEGGSVAQGGDGVSYHVEAQLEGNWGDKLDFWGKVAASDYDTTYHTETLLGPQDGREFPVALFPSPGYGNCVLPGAANVPGCASPSNVDKIVSVQTLPGYSSAANPSTFGTGTYASGFKSRAKEAKDIILAGSATFHADGFDVKYLYGYQNFDYSLTAPWVNNQGVSSGIQGYTLQGPATATPLCGAIFDNAGCTQNLQINSLNNNFTFVEKEYFWSNEINITSRNDGPLQWIGGLYQYHEHYDQPINVNTPDQAQVATPILFSFAPAAPNPTRSVYNEDTLLNEESLGVFGQADWQMNSQLKLTGGVRYSYDHKYGEEQFRVILFDADAVVPGVPLGVNAFGANTPAFDATACTPTSYDGAGVCNINPKTGKAYRSLNAHWDAFTGNAVLTWTPDRDTLFYGKYSRGYKTGGFNSGTMQPNPETQPELVNAFEVGLKKTVGRTIQINASLFYYQYYDDQQPLGALGANGVINTLIVNIPESRSTGAELEGIWSPIKDLQFTGEYSFLDAVITNMDGQCYQDAVDTLAQAPGANQGRGCNTGANAGKGLQDLTGATLPEAPKHKITLNANYTWHFDPGSLSVSGTYVWKDKTYDSVFNRPYNLSPSYNQVNFRTVWTGANNRYSVIFYVNNLFNTIGYDGSAGLNVTSPTAGVSPVIDRLASFTPPRTYGVELQYRFR
jgi:iron complex outermembrane receptor protein